mmetsp:Transcript_126348/g.229399  ORF Transcript_126348/g.229399 Transcript_126348/m.229399 type:complete len:201 (-) Transcript_126348:11-613(-)
MTSLQHDTEPGNASEQALAEELPRKALSEKWFAAEMQMQDLVLEERKPRVLSLPMADHDIRVIIEAAFKTTDVNGDGLISERELRGVFSHLRALSNEEADKLFREADKDDDGNLAYGEFLDWVLGDEQAHTIVTTGGLVATPANAARIVPDWSLSVDMHLNVRGQELPRIALYGTTLKSGEELYMAAYANLDAAPDVKDF